MFKIRTHRRGENIITTESIPYPYFKTLWKLYGSNGCAGKENNRNLDNGMDGCSGHFRKAGRNDSRLKSFLLMNFRNVLWDPVFFYFAVKRAAADSQLQGCLGFVPVTILEDINEKLFLMIYHSSCTVPFRRQRKGIIAGQNWRQVGYLGPLANQIIV